MNNILRKAIEELEIFSNNMQRRKAEGENNRSDREGGHLIYVHASKGMLQEAGQKFERLNCSNGNVPLRNLRKTKGSSSKMRFSTQNTISMKNVSFRITQHIYSLKFYLFSCGNQLMHVSTQNSKISFIFD
jgi:hypothetical protein